MQSENAAEAANETEAQPEGESGLSTLAELLSVDTSTPEGESSDSGDTDEDTTGDAGGNAEQKAAPTEFNAIAEALGIELDALYAMQVKTNNGETVTVQDLKNAFGKDEELTLRELEIEENRTKVEGQLRQAQNELAEIINALPEKAVRPEVLEKIRTRHGEMVAREREKTLDVIPSWRDDKQREDDMVGMAKHLESFGFPASYLGQVIDHRQMNYIRESYLREKRIKAALEKVRAGKPNPTSRSKATGKPPKKGVTKVTPKGGQSQLEAMFSNLD